MAVASQREQEIFRVWAVSAPHGRKVDRFSQVLHTRRASPDVPIEFIRTPSMRLTTKGRYAVTAMLDLALHAEHGPVSVVDVSERQGIPGAYLEQIFAKLRRAGCIDSVRGPGGGYRLTGNLCQLSISDILIAVGEGVDATRCHGAADCQDGAQCMTHDLWSELSDQIDGFLRSITLASLVERVDGKRGRPESSNRPVFRDLIHATNLQP